MRYVGWVVAALALYWIWQKREVHATVSVPLSEIIVKPTGDGGVTFDPDAPLPLRP